MDENNKQVPANITVVRRALLGDGCPVAVVDQLCEYFKQHPEASVWQFNDRLDDIVTRLGYPDYRAFKKAGFRPVQRDEILV